MLAHGRLTNSTFFRDGGEAAFLNDPDERLHGIQSVHIASIFLCGMDCISLVGDSSIKNPFLLGMTSIPRLAGSRRTGDTSDERLAGQDRLAVN
jgi:hypothetical protein